MADQPTLDTATAMAQDDGPSIGHSVSERTHYGHTRYAASDEAGVIWYDPRDGRENFATGQTSADLDDVGDSVITGCSIRPFRPESHGDPAARYVAERHRTERRRYNADRDGYDEYVTDEAVAKNVVCESLAEARAWCAEHIPGYADAEWCDAVSARSDVEVTA